MTDTVTTSYLGCEITVYHDGVVVVTPLGVIRRFGTMRRARLWIRRLRRDERVAG